MPDLSIVIPIYNTPPLVLTRCFASVEALQSLSWEALLIDDGSGEETAVFCQSYAQAHPGFVYLRKDNGGVSSARNLGLQHATGQYIAFVDADDELLPQAFSPQLLQSQADMILMDIQLVQKNAESVWSAFDREGGSVSQAELLRRLIVSQSLNGPWAKLYKTTVIRENELRFDEGFVTGEDWYFVCSFSLCAQSVQYVKTCGYRYYRDGGNALSRLKRFPDRMLSNLIAMYEKKRQVIQSHFSQATDAPALRSAAAALVVEALFNCASDLYLWHLQSPRRKEQIQTVCRQARQELLPSAPKKTRTKACLITDAWASVIPAGYLRALYLKRKH